MSSRNPQEFKENVTNEIKSRKDGTLKNMGWPWPWNDSRTTDYSYVFDTKRSKIDIFEYGRINGQGEELNIFPDMSEIMNVALNSRSGLIYVNRKINTEHAAKIASENRAGQLLERDRDA